MKAGSRRSKSRFNWVNRSSLDGMSAATTAESMRRVRRSLELAVVIIIMPTIAEPKP